MKSNNLKQEYDSLIKNVKRMNPHLLKGMNSYINRFDLDEYNKIVASLCYIKGFISWYYLEHS